MSRYLDWKVGDRVVCIWDFPDRAEECPIKGRVYTIREVLPKGIRLVEIVNAPRYYNEGYVKAGFYWLRFRKVQPRKTDISIFTAMLNDAKQKVGS